MKQIYIRFVIVDKDNDSNQAQGLFAAMGELEEQNLLYQWELEIKKDIYAWFNANLKVPSVLSGHYSKVQAISWFKDSATEHIESMRRYSQILEAHNYQIQQLVTERPGKILYEDDYQIAAIPFVDTFS